MLEPPWQWEIYVDKKADWASALWQRPYPRKIEINRVNCNTPEVETVGVNLANCSSVYYNII